MTDPNTPTDPRQAILDEVIGAAEARADQAALVIEQTILLCRQHGIDTSKTSPADALLKLQRLGVFPTDQSAQGDEPQ